MGPTWTLLEGGGAESCTCSQAARPSFQASLPSPAGSSGHSSDVGAEPEVRAGQGGRPAGGRGPPAGEPAKQRTPPVTRSPALSGPGVLLEAFPSGPSHRGLLWHVLAKVPFREDTFPLLTPSNTSHVTPGDISVYKHVFCFLFPSK